TDGVSYVFAESRNAILAPGECVVIVKNAAAFASRYDTAGIQIAPGAYTGSLDNAGETIKLEDRTNSTILEFDYDDDWFDQTDGEGHSLTIADPANESLDNWGDPGAWRPSAEQGGSPGFEDAHK
ncbi:MAG: hypothetical protein JW741_18950, partial [Sedimentisphaerales bacterium]|nr:hypothetical protein [Sedimentisphaerales bacterium]